MGLRHSTDITAIPSRRQHRGDPARADFGHNAAHSVRGGIAVLDSEGVVRWTNDAWHAADSTLTGMGDAPVGSNFLQLVAFGAGPFSGAMSGAIMAVLAGAISYVELHLEADAGTPVKLEITPLHRGGGGAVLHAESVGNHAVAAGVPLVIDAAQIAERLTPRELDVVARMATGLSNRAIASELGIEYTTVRGYVQSVLSKLGARSRVDAVARAYRSGLVRETAS